MNISAVCVSPYYSFYQHARFKEFRTSRLRCRLVDLCSVSIKAGRCANFWSQIAQISLASCVGVETLTCAGDIVHQGPAYVTVAYVRH
jgi:hypothetical protein